MSFADEIKKWKNTVLGLNARIKEQEVTESKLICEKTKLQEQIQDLKDYNKELRKQNDNQATQIKELQRQLLSSNQQTGLKREIKEFQQKSNVVQMKVQTQSQIQLNKGEHEEEARKFIEQFFSGISSQLTKNSQQNISQSLFLKQINQFMELNPQYKPPYEQPKEQPKEFGKSLLELFESFYIFGADKDIVFQLNNTQEITFRNPAILYKYYKVSALKDENEMKNLKQLELFIQHTVFPLGFKATKHNQEQFEDIYEQILSSQFNSKFKDNFFTFNANGKDFLQTSYKNFSTLNTINPNRQLFGYCLVLDDFFIENSLIKSYWKFKKILCFTTYFPISEIFESLLVRIAEILKVLRMDFDQVNKKKGIENFDGLKLIEQTKDILSDTLNQMQNYEVKQITTKQEILEIDTPKLKLQIQGKDNKPKEFQFEKIQYQIPEKEIFFRESRRQLAELILKTFSYEKFFTIFSKILLEQKVIFFCENINYLTRIIQFFQNIVHPLIWVNPIIFIASEQSISFGDLDIPYIMGVNQSESNFRKKKIRSFESPDIFFVHIELAQNSQKYECAQFSKSEGLIYKPSKELNIYKCFNQKKLEPKSLIEFQKELENFMKNEIVNRILPKHGREIYIANQNFNEELFIQNVKQKLKEQQIEGQKNQFLLEISKTRYFQEYTKSKSQQQIRFLQLMKRETL